MIILAELQPLDTTAGVRKTLRASSANDPAVTGLNSVIWRPAISEEASIGIRLFKGDFDGEAAPTGGSISIQIDQWLHIEANARKFLWAGAPIKLYAGVSGQAWPWSTVFDGLVEGFTAEKNTIKLQFKVNTEPFDADVLTLKYAGTGGAEGSADLKDKTKPFLLGRCFNVEPILINSVDNVLQFSGYGAVQAINVLYERGSDFGPSMGDYTSYATLVAATIPPGKWASCLAQGMVRLGAPAYGVITGDVDGDNVGGWWRKTGEIIQRVASNSAVSGSLIESASFTALDTALVGLSNQGRIGVFIDSQESVLEFASRLAAPCNAQVGVSLAGKLFVGRVAIGSPTLTLDAQQRRLPRVTSSVESSVQTPFSYIEMGYARSWRVHSNDEIAGIDVLISARYPDPPPEVMLEGGIYVNATNKQFRYVGPTVFSDEGDAFSDEGLITSSGYEDIQDLAISDADFLAQAAVAQAAAAQAAAEAASIAAIEASLQFVVVPPAPATIFCNYLGVPKPGQVPKVLTPSITRAGVDMRTSGDVSHSLVTSPLSLDASIDNVQSSPDKGRITLGVDWSGPATLPYLVEFMGVRYGPYPISISRQNDPAPTTGGVSGSIKSGSDSSFSTVTSTAFAPISDEIIVDVTSGETISVTAALDYQVNGGAKVTTRSMLAKAQYALVSGGGYTDFPSSPVTGTDSIWFAFDYEGEPGSITINQAQAGLATNQYKVRIVAALSALAGLPEIDVIYGTMNVTVS